MDADRLQFLTASVGGDAAAQPATADGTATLTSAPAATAAPPSLAEGASGSGTRHAEAAAVWSGAAMSVNASAPAAASSACAPAAPPVAACRAFFDDFALDRARLAASRGAGPPAPLTDGDERAPAP